MKSYSEYAEVLWEVYQKGINEIPCDNDDLKKELFLGIVTKALSQIISKMDVKTAYSKAPCSVASVVPVVME